MKYDKFADGRIFYFHKDIVRDSTAPKNEKHYHNLFEIYYITEGACTYFINNKSYNLVAGDIILIPSGTIHNAEYKIANHTRLLINCSNRFIPASVRPLLPQMIYLYRNPVIADEIADLFLKIEQEYTMNDEIHEEILSCYTHMLFFTLARNIKTKEHISTTHDYIEKSAEYMQKNFTTDITLTDIAKMYGVTPVHFSRTFKKETGFGFSEYLNILRLQKAETMLKSGVKKTITEIAGECGFTDSNYFSVKFKKMYGKSPKNV